MQVVLPPKICTKFNTRPLASIAVSSSIGDPKFGMNPFLEFMNTREVIVPFLGPILNPHPVVIHQTLSSHGFVFVGTDGLWDAISKEELQQLVKKQFTEFNVNSEQFNELDVDTLRNIAKSLGEHLPQIAWDKYGPATHARDDITLVIAHV